MSSSSDSWVRRRGDHGGRVLVLALDSEVRRWIEHELFGEPVVAMFVANVADAARALAATGPTRFGALIVELGSLAPGELERVLAARDDGWAGAVIVIGAPASDASKSLGIDRVLEPFGNETLREALRDAGEDRATTRIRPLGS